MLAASSTVTYLCRELVSFPWYLTISTWVPTKSQPSHYWVSRPTMEDNRTLITPLWPHGNHYLELHISSPIYENKSTNSWRFVQNIADITNQRRTSSRKVREYKRAAQRSRREEATPRQHKIPKYTLEQRLNIIRHDGSMLQIEINGTLRCESYYEAAVPTLAFFVASRAGHTMRKYQKLRMARPQPVNISPVWAAAASWRVVGVWYT